MKVNYSRILLGLIDAGIVILSPMLSFAIRFDGVIPIGYLRACLLAALPLSLINLIFFYLFGLYNQIWSYASIDALLSVVYAVSCGALGGMVYLLFAGGSRFPYSVVILAWMINLLLIGGSRFVWRIVREKVFRKSNGNGGSKRVIIYGAGDAGEAILREMQRRGDAGYKPVCFVDDDINKKGMKIHGVRVLGVREDLQKLIKPKKVDEVIIAIPSASGSTIKSITEECKKANVKCKTLPPIYDLFNGKVGIKDIRDVDVEDLLGREQVKFDLEDIRKGIEGKVVLITGAGGSIGSELSRQIALCAPGRLVLVGHGENSIYHIDLEMHEKFSDLEVQSIIGNVRDRDKMFKIMQTHRPDFVFHAAAYKHVHLMEAHPDEAILNNVYGTKNVAEAAIDAGVEKFILISTDKAVNPKGVMGYSKRLAELIVLGLQGKGRTKFIVTRFGNVLGSRGSVIPLFKRQIKKGGPLTVTHPDVVRFFMTIPEAVHLVIRAALMGRGGEVFVLDMGEPMKIADLAKELITLSGREVDKDIKIEFTGLRPGEKLFEELAGKKERLEGTSHKKIYVAKPSHGSLAQRSDQINKLKDLIEISDVGDLKRKLMEMTKSEGALIC